MKSADRRTALSLAGAAFALAAPAAYVSERLFEVARSAGPVDPLMVVRDAHAAFYWRAATATWWAGLIAIVVFAWVRRRGGEDRLGSILTWIGAPLVLAVALLAWWFP